MESLVCGEMLSVGWIIKYPRQCPTERLVWNESNVILQHWKAEVKNILFIAIPNHHIVHF